MIRLVENSVDSYHLSEDQFRRISDLVYEHCGINLHDGKKELVRSRLAKLLRKYRCAGFDDYLRLLEGDTSGAAFSEMIDLISTNLTSFFREPQHFDFLSGRFLPELMEARLRQHNLRLRAWSAGCSSGEEPYSIAITLAEATGNSPEWDWKLLASDISTRILEKAQAGLYEESRVASVSPSLRSRYLIRQKDSKNSGDTLFRVHPDLRRHIAFRYLNLMEPWPFRGPMDFIFCRNVMIYFDKPTQQKLIDRFWEILAPGGILFTGHSESLTGIRHRFTYIQPTIYRKGS